MNLFLLFQAFHILFTADNHATDHVSSTFPGSYDHRTCFSIVNKSQSESMSFIIEMPCKFIFTDVHMRNNYSPNRAFDYILGHKIFLIYIFLHHYKK